jgi:mercuric ion transport protein
MAATHSILEPRAQRNGTQEGAGARAGKRLVSLGSILAAAGAASCCVIPFALATLGISGAWIGNFTALAPYQPYFLGLTALLLAGGFFLVYRKRKPACAEDSYCARPASNRIAKIALWSATVLVVIAVAFPYAAPRLFEL